MLFSPNFAGFFGELLRIMDYGLILLADAKGTPLCVFAPLRAILFSEERIIKTRH